MESFYVGDYMMKQTNCPNCGAPIMDTKCPYCGTLFYDFAAISVDEPFYLKIKSKGKIHIMKVVMEHATWSIDCPGLDCTCTEYPFLIVQQQERKLDMSFRLV